MKHKITAADLLKLAAVALTIGIIGFIRAYPTLFPPPINENTVGGLLQAMSQDGQPLPQRSAVITGAVLGIGSAMVFFSARRPSASLGRVPK